MGRPRKVRTKVCPQCGVEHSPKDWRSVYCGYRCASIARQDKLRGGPMPTKECERCGRTFAKSNEYSYAVWATIRFCSTRCRGNGRDKTVISCAQCGERFTSANAGRSVYCSQECYFERLRKIDYPLRTRGSGEFSKPIKRLLLERAGGCCENCGSAEDLEFDHVVPRFMGGDGSLENGQVLCSVCHDCKTLDQRPSARSGQKTPAQEGF